LFSNTLQQMLCNVITCLRDVNNEVIGPSPWEQTHQCGQLQRGGLETELDINTKSSKMNRCSESRSSLWTYMLNFYPPQLFLFRPLAASRLLRRPAPRRRSRSPRSPSWRTSRRARWSAASSAWTRCWRRCGRPPASWETRSWAARWRRRRWPSAGTSSSPPRSTPTERRRRADEGAARDGRRDGGDVEPMLRVPTKHVNVYMNISRQCRRECFLSRLDQSTTRGNEHENVWIVIYCTVIKSKNCNPQTSLLFV